MLRPRITHWTAAFALATTLGLFPVCALADESQAQALPADSATVATQVQESTAGEGTGSGEDPSATVDATSSEPKAQDVVTTEEPQQQDSQQTTAETDEKPEEPATDEPRADTSGTSATADASATEPPAESGVGASEDETPAATTAAATTAATSASSQPAIKMYRIYNRWTGEHLFTSNADEVRTNVALGWTDEGIGWEAPETSSTPVYRLYNPYSGDHHYTTSEDEYKYLGTIGWNQEGIGFYSPDNDTDAVAVYRLFNPYETVGTHHYTLSESEYDYLGTIGWNQEGIGWYAIDTASSSITASFADGEGSTESVVSTDKGGVTYLVLPSYTNTSSVTLSFSANGSAVTAQLGLPSGTATIASTGTAVDLSSTLGATISYSTSLGSHPLVVLKSGNVSTIYVSSVDPTKNRAWVEASPDHSAKANVNITMVASDG